MSPSSLVGSPCQLNESSLLELLYALASAFDKALVFPHCVGKTGLRLL